MLFYPKRAFFEPKTLDYPTGQYIYNKLKELNIPIFIENKSVNFEKDFDNIQEYYAYAKGSLVVSIKKSMKLDSCKPSADYQFPLVTGCPASCQYCYLQSNPNIKPFARVYANVEEILQNNEKYINQNKPKITSFELASTSDPLSVEHLTGSVKKAIEFFAQQEYGRLRLVTKFAYVDTLLDIEHNRHTKIRFSINSKYVVDKFEFNVSPLMERLEAAQKVYDANYPLGFIIAPIYYYENYKEEYAELLDMLRDKIKNPDNAEITFELIQHRFTTKAMDTILARFPNTEIDFSMENRQQKWGPYGVYKYVYKKDISSDMKEFMISEIKRRFPKAEIEYFT
jgi:spore photoproduct lyase